MKDLRPLLATFASPARTFAQSLPATASRADLSPWSPRAEHAVQSVDAVEIAQAARERGLADGLTQTAALRERLSSVLMALESAHERVVELASAQIADATVSALGAWVEREDRAALFAPLIKRWLARCAGEQATCVRVHPGDVDALRIALDGAPLEIVPDPAISAGDLTIRGGAFEVAHRWTERLQELRELVIAALDAERGTP